MNINEFNAKSQKGLVCNPCLELQRIIVFIEYIEY
jgi:hypothetical protein